jgi:transcriptional regulator with XRE-family HTH domain
VFVLFSVIIIQRQNRKINSHIWDFGTQIFTHIGQKHNKKGQNSIMFRQISVPDGTEQWLINLIEIYNRTGKSFKQIAEEQGLAEKSVSNVFLGKSKNPGVDLIRRILTSLGAQWREIFGESGAVIGGQDLATLQAEVDRLNEENALLTSKLDIAAIDNTVLKDKVTTLENENKLLCVKLEYEEKLNAVHSFYNKLSNN